MDFDDYQIAAARTANPTFANFTRVTVDLHGLAAEAGEVCALYQKAAERNEVVPIERLADKLGDLLWRITDLCSAYGIGLDEVAERNIAKHTTLKPGAAEANP
jgi:NTP pyrophosphatase (non-canonical NTP hydrolase)